nr:ileal sodium/bile acid cotransporter-like [Lytechinus pictus]
MATNLTMNPLDSSQEFDRKALEHTLSTVSFYISYTGIAVALFSMGCVISIKDFSDKDKHLSKSVVIGIAFQSLFLPLIGYGLALLLQMDVFDAMAMIILSCCPVSPFCAVFVYYGEGVVMVGLSLAMFSTALSVGLIPFWFSLYSSSWTQEYYVIGTPSDIVLAEVEIFIPTALGLLYKRLYGKKNARLMAKVCSNAFWVAVILSPILSGIAYPGDFDAEWQIWVAAIVLPLSGFFCGLFLSLLFNLPFQVCSAISLAVGTPNWFIAKSLATHFFSGEEETLHGVITLLSIFSITLPIEGFIWSIMFRNIQEFFTKLSPKCCCNADDDDDDEKDRFDVIEIDDIEGMTQVDIKVSHFDYDESVA